MFIYSIYRITNLITNKVYIGYTSNPKTRWNKHCRSALTSAYPKRKLYRSVLKHGIEHFTFDVIYQSLNKDHTKHVMENYFITEYNSLAHGYNMTNGGEGGDTSASPTYKLGIANRDNSYLKNNTTFIRGVKQGPQSESHKKNRALAATGKKRKIVMCPHCSKEGGEPAMKRYHFDKCKFFLKSCVC